MIPEKMKSVVMTSPRAVELHEYAVPELTENGVLIQIKSAAICTIDQRPYAGVTKGFFPRVGGHEGAGVVIATGKNVVNTKVGDHVTVGRIHCGVCENCIKGRGHCLNAPDFGGPGGEKPSIEKPQNLFGSFSQYIVRNENEFFHIPETLNFSHAALAEPLSDVVHSIRRSRLALGETCVIIGAGIMGILHAQVARNIGARVIVSEVDAARRDRVAEFADYVVNPKETDPREFVKSLTGGRGSDVVFFAIAVSSMFEQAYSMLAETGRIMVYSNQHPDDPFGLRLGQIHRSEFEIIGTSGSLDLDFVNAVELMSFGKMNMEKVIHGEYPITKCKEAFDQSIVPGTYRVVIKMDEE
ncbi:MAG: zinc-binding dehydrogenase [Peptococcaceae bacterium]|jgi:L-iditol 2-dehydrogenase|nr:zinc-binding dehydrogenase [Peptococcaceae bacterium]